MTSELSRRVLAGEVHAVARLISRLESHAPGSDDQLAEIYGAGGRARLIGITGSPGTGKSTLVAALTAHFRRSERRVGIVAVDPTSPYSGGAILGDRIRMGAFSGDPGVFIRSMATRGAMGGLARATADAVAVLDAAGYDLVLVETVGVGQDEVDISRACHTVVVVSAPGLGDDIQAIKAGVIEIADVHVVNKADREGANRTVSELKLMLNLAGPGREGEWKPPVLTTIADSGRGVEELAARLSEHCVWQSQPPRREERESVIASFRIRAIAAGILQDQVLDPTQNEGFQEAVRQVSQREIDPLQAARRLIGGAGLR